MSDNSLKPFDLFPVGEDDTPYKKLTSDHVSVDDYRGQKILHVEAEGIRLLCEQGFMDINHLLRPKHLKQLASILDDPEATENDRFVAYDLLKNANIAAGGVLPDVPGYRHGHRHGQEGHACVDRWQRRGRARQGRAGRL